MIYLLFFWIVCLTFVVITLCLKSRVKKETKEIWTLPTYIGTDMGVTSEVTYTKTAPQFVEFLGADRVGEIMAEKKDVKIDDILTN